MFQLGCDYCGIIGYGINLTVMEDVSSGEKKCCSSSLQPGMKMQAADIRKIGTGSVLNTRNRSIIEGEGS